MLHVTFHYIETYYLVGYNCLLCSISKYKVMSSGHTKLSKTFLMQNPFTFKFPPSWLLFRIFLSLLNCAGQQLNKVKIKDTY